MPLRAVWVVAVMLVAAAGYAADESELRRAERLAWDKHFTESEALYRRILEQDPASREASLGLARVVMWQGRYREAIELFDRIGGIDAVEGRATAEYWSGDLRRAARSFRQVLAIDSQREFSRRSLAEIESTARPFDRIGFEGVHDDQPMEALRGEIASTFFTDPLTRWTLAAGAYHLDADRIGRRGGATVRLENETKFGRTGVGGSAGLFQFPDGVRRPIGSMFVRHRALTLRVERREELASATAVRTHAASTTTSVRWDHDRDWIAAVEASHRRYFDQNEARALVAYAVVPWRREAWTFWGGISAAARDADESRFRLTAVSSTREGAAFRYSYRGEYDPYWTPIDLLEARAVVAVERRSASASIKVHADGGFARDRARAFGPDLGPTPFPAAPFAVEFDRSHHPWRAGLTADWRIGSWRFEAGAERSVTVDYRSTSFHAALVRRR